MRLSESNEASTWSNYHWKQATPFVNSIYAIFFKALPLPIVGQPKPITFRLASQSAAMKKTSVRPFHIGR